MTPVRAPDVVRGDVPGLLCRGMPVFVLRQTPEDDEAEPCDGERLRLAEQAVVTDHGDDAGWLVATGRTVDPCGPNWSQLQAADVAIDWSDRAAIYLSLAWLADRGHPCFWMLPTTHGGRVEAWDGLSAWEVSAIVVARSVGRVGRGLGPIRVLGGPWRHPAWSTEAHIRVAMNAFADGHGLAVVRDTDPYGEGERGWLLQPIARMVWSRDDVPHGPETGDAGKLAADRAALADGCTLQVPGGLILPDIGAEHE